MAEVAGDSSDGAGHGAFDFDLAVSRFFDRVFQFGGEFFAMRVDGIAILIADDDPRHSREWRQADFLSARQFGGSEAGVVVAEGGGDRGVFRQKSLERDAAGAVAATGAAGDLRDELERSLAGAEVGECEGGVAADDADKSDVGVVQSLGDHLGAEHDLDFAARESSERGFVFLEGAHGVAVDSCDIHSREFFGEFFFDALGAESEETEFFSAGDASRGQGADG